MKKLAIITTHPIQYNAPLFELLSQRGIIQIKVFYTWGAGVMKDKYDPGFKKNISWDIPLLNGYNYQFVENIAKKPGSHHYIGIDNPTLISEIKKWQADGILVFGWNFKSHLKCLKYFSKKLKVIFRGDSTLLDENQKGIKSIIKKLILKSVYKNVDFCLYVGNENKKYYLKYGVKENQLIFAPHAIDNLRFSIKNEESLRKELSLKQNDFVFLFAGKLERKKNPLLLLNSFIELNIPHTFLLIVGNGELEVEIKNICSSLEQSIRNRILIIDFQNQQRMPLVYKTANVFILPSQGPGETWGLAVNEAMASGVPVIVSDKCGCYTDLINNFKNGLVFKSNNSISLKSAMKHMATHIKESNLMGKNAETFISNWSFERICTSIESTFKA